MGYQILLFGLLLVAAGSLLAGHSYRHNRKVTPLFIGLFSLISMMSIGVYAFLGTTQPDRQEVVLLEKVSDGSDRDNIASMMPTDLNQQRINEIQNELREDTQNGELWYALGNAYMYSSQFEEAGTAFFYASKLAEEPQANIYSAMATASYYDKGQNFTPESQQWLDKAFELDEDNIPALMLQATDYFLTARYQRAIDTWQQALDTERTDLDRVKLINAINRAKGLI
ncbi:TPR domain-containing protein [Photobacterium minamisatsumaniensis]|uniref:TPR domain-containing protein n=1 Tax=Photobacterium minamisatsumaniensis TaxID=2910233 RepID=UPI003D09A828